MNKRILLNFALQTAGKVAEIGLYYKKKPAERTPIKISCSKQAYDLVLPLMEQNGDFDFRERFYILYLNRANVVLTTQELSVGGQSGTVADPKLIFSVGLLVGASGIILAHNHPSGSLVPSQADNILTQKVKEAGNQMDMPVIDHLILTRHGYYSYADEGAI